MTENFKLVVDSSPFSQADIDAVDIYKDMLAADNAERYNRHVLTTEQRSALNRINTKVAPLTGLPSACGSPQQLSLLAERSRQIIQSNIGMTRFPPPDSVS